MISSIFNILRTMHTFLHSGCAHLHFYLQWTRVPFPSTLGYHLLFLAFLIIAILTSMMWYLIIALICFSLISRCLSIFSCIWWLSACLEKCLFRSSAHFVIRLLFCYWVIWVYYKSCMLTCYQIYDLQIFPPIQEVAFSLCWWILCYAESVQFDVVPLVYFCLCCLCF